MIQSGAGSRLPAPADLARILRAGIRSSESLKITGPIREAVARRVQKLSEGSALNTCPAPSPIGGHRVQFLDRVGIGVKGLRPVLYLQDGAMWWGAYLWASWEDVKRLPDGFRELDVAVDEWVLEDGFGDAEMPEEVWSGGGYFRAFKRLQPEQLEELETLNDLVEEVASDLWWWYQRLDELKYDLGKYCGYRNMDDLG